MENVFEKKDVSKALAQQNNANTTPAVVSRQCNTRMVFLTVTAIILLFASCLSIFFELLPSLVNIGIIVVSLTFLVFMCGAWYNSYITHKHTQQKKSDIETHITNLLHKLPLPALVLSTENAIITDVNQASLDLFGFKRDELIGSSVFKYVKQWESPVIENAHIRYLEDGLIVLPNMMRATKDGNTVLLDVTAVLLSQAPEYYSLVILQDKTASVEIQRQLEAKYNDVMQQVRALQANLQNLTHKEERYHALFSQSMIAVLLLDATTHIIRDANPQADRLLGIRHADLLGKAVSTLPGGIKMIEVLSQVSASAGALPTEIELERRDGSHIYLDVISSPIKLSTEDMLMLALRDTTERHQLYKKLEATNASLQEQSLELLKLNEQLQRTNVIKTQFLANMSHEIRTPLNAINGFAELLSDEAYGVLTDEQKSFANRIIDAGQHLLQLINDVIDLAKVEAGKIELDWQPMRANHVVEQAVKIIRGTARNNQISIRIHNDDDDPIVFADERRVKQVLFNLLSNAIRYSPEGTRVDVTVEGDGNWVTISVKDHGPGIALEDQERIFEEFVRVGDTIHTTTGAGLGLPLSRHLIDLHGGRLSLISNPGEGSTFYFSLPVAKLPPLPDMTQQVTDDIAQQYSDNQS